MKLFEDYIRRHFREATSTKEIEADDLWADIEASLPPESEEEPVVGSPFRGIILGLVLLGGLFIAGLLLWPLGDEEQRVLADSAEGETVAVGSEGSPSTGQTDPSSGTSQGLANDAETKAANASLRSPSASLKELYPAPAGPAKKTAPLSSQTKARSNFPTGATADRTEEQGENAGAGTLRASSQTTETSTAKTILIKAGVLPTSQLNSPANESTSPSRLSNTTASGVDNGVNALSALSALVRIPSLAIEPLRIDEKPLALPQLLPYTSSPETFRKSGTAKLEFSASVGSSLMLRKYLNPSEGNAVNALNAAVGNTFGQSVSLEFSYRLSNKLRLNSGLEYWRTHNTFRYTIERDSFTVHPSFPERTTAAQYIRRITHNNYQQFLALPILLEYRQVFGRFEAGLGAGLALNYQLQANGRTLASRDEVVSYDSSSGDTPDFFLSYRLRPSLMFSPKPNSRTKFRLQTDVQYYRFGESSVTGLSQRAILLGGSIGITYRL